MQVEAQRVDARLDRQVRSDYGRRLLGIVLGVVGLGLLDDDLDAGVDQLSVQLADAVRAELDLLDGGGDLDRKSVV